MRSEAILNQITHHWKFLLHRETSEDLHPDHITCHISRIMHGAFVSLLVKQVTYSYLLFFHVDLFTENIVLVFQHNQCDICMGTIWSVYVLHRFYFQFDFFFFFLTFLVPRLCRYKKNNVCELLLLFCLVFLLYKASWEKSADRCRRYLVPAMMEN